MYPHGFGLHTFKEELTGPEYAGRFISQVKDLGNLENLKTLKIVKIIHLCVQISRIKRQLQRFLQKMRSTAWYILQQRVM